MVQDLISYFCAATIIINERCFSFICLFVVDLHSSVKQDTQPPSVATGEVSAQTDKTSVVGALAILSLPSSLYCSYCIP